MHGALPHAMILCTQPSRTSIHRNPWVPIPSVRDVIALYETAMKYLRVSPVIAIAMNTYDLSDDDAQRAIKQVQAETGLPATDTVRYDPAPIAAAVDTFHRARNSGGK